MQMQQALAYLLLLLVLDHLHLMYVKLVQDQEALDHPPFLLILDDLHQTCVRLLQVQEALDRPLLLICTQFAVDLCRCTKHWTTCYCYWPCMDLHLSQLILDDLHLICIEPVQVQEALDHLPSLLILDDLHLICAAQAEGPEGPNTNNSAALVEWLCDVLDSFHPPGKPAFPGTLLLLALLFGCVVLCVNDAIPFDSFSNGLGLL